MAFHPLTPAEPPPEPFQPKAWHGMVLVGALIVVVPGIVLLARRDTPAPVPPSASGAYSEMRDTALGGGGEIGIGLGASETPSLAVYTIPVGVQITLDGAPAGVTPYRASDLERRPYRVSLRADGYLPIDTLARLDVTPRALLAVDLVADPSRPPPPPASIAEVTPPPAPAPAPVDDRPGELTIAVVPWGTITVDGQVRARETDMRQTFSLAPGSHRVVAEHPTLGRREFNVEVRPGRTTDLSVELTP